MIRLESKGDFSKTENYLKKLKDQTVSVDLNQYGRMGVAALAAATPVDTGLASNSWGYRLIKDSRGSGIEWFNTDIENGFPVAILIQYGHATGTGGYVAGIDYINPAMRPIFDMIEADVWKKVKT